MGKEGRLGVRRRRLCWGNCKSLFLFIRLTFESLDGIVGADSVESAENGGLNSIAKIDTTVTVVDAFRFFEEFETIELLHQRFASEVETPEDERTVTDLIIDQIEFADVIIVNKVRIFSPSPTS